MPKVVVAMGPMTATALTEIGISDVVVATEQSLSGLMEATARALASR
jgi:uroporphyrinogen-III synthase